MSAGTVGSQRDFSNVRISNVGWLNDKWPFIRRLSHKVELATGLDATTRMTRDRKQYKSGEEFQVLFISFEWLL